MNADNFSDIRHLPDDHCVTITKAQARELVDLIPDNGQDEFDDLANAFDEAQAAHPSRRYVIIQIEE